jgi:hypothetical protein
MLEMLALTFDHWQISSHISLIKNCFVEVYFRFSNVILEERMQPLRVEGEDLKGGICGCVLLVQFELQSGKPAEAMLAWTRGIIISYH